MPMPDAPTLFAAFTAGVLGSVHCAAMCGGIATALVATRPQRALRTAIEINAGRIAGYVLAGAISGFVGGALLGVLRAPWLGTTVRALGGMVLVLVALRMLDRRARFTPFARPAAALWQRLRPLQKSLLPADHGAKRFALGMLWGWMPCGLSLMLLTAAWLQADPFAAAATMAAFGAGTLPTMLPLSWTGARVLRRLQGPVMRPALACTILVAGLLTATAPLLARIPGLHGTLAALGCLAA
jgi:sulfite exporter TauE/SafE